MRFYVCQLDSTIVFASPNALFLVGDRVHDHAVDRDEFNRLLGELQHTGRVEYNGVALPDGTCVRGFWELLPDGRHYMTCSETIDPIQPSDIAPQMLKVAVGIAEQKMYKHISRDTGIPQSTVEAYASRLRKKLGVTTNVGVGYWAVRVGLIGLDDPSPLRPPPDLR